MQLGNPKVNKSRNPGNKLKQIDRLIEKKHVKDLLNCKPDDIKRQEELEQSFCNDMKELWLEENESKDLYKQLKKHHL